MDGYSGTHALRVSVSTCPPSAGDSWRLLFVPGGAYGGRRRGEEVEEGVGIRGRGGGGWGEGRRRDDLNRRPTPTAPLITAEPTLAACLESHATYLCTSYTPRCFIIQKVTPNSLAVSGGGGQPPPPPPGFPPLPSASPSAPSSRYARTHSSTSRSSLTFPHQLKFESPAHPHSGRVYMNGEIGPGSVGGGPAVVEMSAGAATASPLVYGIPGQLHQQQQPLPLYHEHAVMNGGMEMYGGGEGEEGGESNGALHVNAPIIGGHPHGVHQQHTPDHLPLEQLKHMLTAQLEYYFSPENLNNDKFLVSQMDGDHYVYISTLANFNMIKKLTSNVDLVTQVLRESKNMQVHPDGKRVRPMSHRTIIILRGIPKHTSADEIRGLFEEERSPTKCTGCEFAGNDSWYVSFESDEDAQTAHRYLREDVREFKGQPIMARIKSRPTTLLNSGVKNGYSVGGPPPPHVIGGIGPGGLPPPPPPFLTASAQPFVPAVSSHQLVHHSNHTGAHPHPHQPPLYATAPPGQNLPPSVFTLPANTYHGGGFSPWAAAAAAAANFYDLNMFAGNGMVGGGRHSGAVNAVAAANSALMGGNGSHRQRPPNGKGAYGGPSRRPPPSNNDQQGMNGILPPQSLTLQPSFTPVTTASPSIRPQQPKTNAPTSVQQPPPLLGMAPPNAAGPAPVPSSSSSAAGSTQSLNGGGSSRPTYHQQQHSNNQQQHLTQPPYHGGGGYGGSSNPDSYHYQSTNRSYRGGAAQDSSRPRSSLGGVRRGGGRRGGEEEGHYHHYNGGEYHGGSNHHGGGHSNSHHHSHQQQISSYRPSNSSSRSGQGGGGPSASSGPSSSSPATATPNISGGPGGGGHQVQANHQIALDLEGSAFPPLPGTGPPKTNNGGDSSPYEGRLSDVVKGVKGVSVSSANNVREEIVVSALDPQDVVVVSAGGGGGEDGEESSGSGSSSQGSSRSTEGPAAPTQHKKETREIGVGSADEAAPGSEHPNGSSYPHRSNSHHSSGGRQTADKSTRTEDSLLSGGKQEGGSPCKVREESPAPVPSSVGKSGVGTKPFSGLTDHLPNKGTKGEERGGKETGQGDGTSGASGDEGGSSGGPVRLSYAQIAMMKQKEGAAAAAAPTSTAPTPPATSSPTTISTGTSTDDPKGNKRGSGPATQSTGTQASSPSFTKEPQHQRSNQPKGGRGGRGGGRGGGGGGGFRSRLASDNSSVDGGNGGGRGNNNYGGGRRARSPPGGPVAPTSSSSSK